jgi:hypothetical protein
LRRVTRESGIGGERLDDYLDLEELMFLDNKSHSVPRLGPSFHYVTNVTIRAEKQVDTTVSVDQQGVCDRS